MVDDSSKEPFEGYDDEIDLRELFSVLWQGKTSIGYRGSSGSYSLRWLCAVSA